jgi:electron transfer flavoprotein alpha subunit
VIAVVVVRGGELPLGGDEAVAEAGGRAVLVGEGATTAAEELAGIAEELRCAEVAGFAPAGWAAGLAELVAGEDVVVLPASADGRDLAPRLAAALGRPLLAGALLVRPDGARLATGGGTSVEDVSVDGPFVATLQPGARGVEVAGGRVSAVSAAVPAIRTVSLRLTDAPTPELLAVLPADPSTMDLAEAGRIVGGGAGLGSPGAFDVLRAVGLALGASTGGTRVVTDWGWLPPSAQIGTTGVSVQPRLYLALGISGAVQHVAGLGQPDHVISVNTDPSCPMMAMADLAVVADAPAVLAALAARLGVDGDGVGAGVAGPAGADRAGADRADANRAGADR